MRRVLRARFLRPNRWLGVETARREYDRVLEFVRVDGNVASRKLAPVPAECRIVARAIVEARLAGAAEAIAGAGRAPRLITAAVPRE